MRSISKAEHCIENAKKCVNRALSMHYAIILAPSKEDEELCERKYKRAIKHSHKYIELANLYGGK